MSQCIVFNRASFNVEINARRTEQEFIDRWTPVLWPELKPSDKAIALAEAYKVILMEAGLDKPPGAEKTDPSIDQHENKVELPQDPVEADSNTGNVKKSVKK